MSQNTHTHMYNETQSPAHRCHVHSHYDDLSVGGIFQKPFQMHERTHTWTRVSLTKCTAAITTKMSPQSGSHNM